MTCDAVVQEKGGVIKTESTCRVGTFSDLTCSSHHLTPCYISLTLRFTIYTHTLICVRYVSPPTPSASTSRYWWCIFEANRVRSSQRFAMMVWHALAAAATSQKGPGFGVRSTRSNITNGHHAESSTYRVPVMGGRVMVM